jgi:uncharacterized membrane protein
MSTSAQGPDSGTDARTDAGGRKHTAGAYDVRVFIAGLIGFYGVVLIIVGLVGNSSGDDAKTGHVNANLWAGIVMAVIAIAFALWTWWRPVVVDPRAVDQARAIEEANRRHS